MALPIKLDGLLVKIESVSDRVIFLVILSASFTFAESLIFNSDQSRYLEHQCFEAIDSASDNLTIQSGAAIHV